VAHGGQSLMTNASLENPIARVLLSSSSQLNSLEQPASCSAGNDAPPQVSNSYPPSQTEKKRNMQYHAL
jgi:hypothetical protein